MAWKLMKVGNATNAPSNYYVVDTTNDIKDKVNEATKKVKKEVKPKKKSSKKKGSE